jgi:hypothetical protein
MLDGVVGQGLGPIIRRFQISFACGQPDTIENKCNNGESASADQEGRRHAQNPDHYSPSEAPASHGPVDDHQIHGKTAAANLVRQDRLRRTVERRQRDNPCAAKPKQDHDGKPLRRGESQYRHGGGGDDRGAEQQAISVELAAQLR